MQCGTVTVYSTATEHVQDVKSTCVQLSITSDIRWSTVCCSYPEVSELQGSVQHLCFEGKLSTELFPS